MNKNLKRFMLMYYTSNSFTLNIVCSLFYSLSKHRVELFGDVALLAVHLLLSHPHHHIWVGFTVGITGGQVSGLGDKRKMLHTGSKSHTHNC